MSNVFIHLPAKELWTVDCYKFIKDHIQEGDKLHFINCSVAPLVQKYFENYQCYCYESLYNRFGAIGVEAEWESIIEDCSKFIGFMGATDLPPRPFLIAAKRIEDNQIFYKLL